jgi:recombination protein RecT
MAKKTVLRQLLSKWGIMSVEMQQAYTADQGVIDEDGTVRYVDNPNSVPVEVQVQEDIQTNANTEEFVEAEVVEPVKEDAPAPKQKGRPKSKTEEVVAEAPASFEEPEVPAYEDFPDEPDFSK